MIPFSPLNAGQTVKPFAPILQVDVCSCCPVAKERIMIPNGKYEAKVVLWHCSSPNPCPVLGFWQKTDYECFFFSF